MTSIKTSARYFSTYCKLLDLTPETVSGYKSILDVGAGLSEFTGRSLELGVNAVAVDFRYSDIDVLTKQYLLQPLPDSVDEMTRQFRGRIDGCSTLAEMQGIIRKDREQRVRKFLNYYLNYQDSFKQGNCFDLPHDKDSFDLSLSVELIFNRRYFTQEQAVHSLKEMLRVAREVRVQSYVPVSFDGSFPIEGVSYNLREGNYGTLLILQRD